MSAHALCRCAEAGGTADCPIHGSPTRTLGLSQQPLPRVACDYCGEPVRCRWNTGATLDDRYLAVAPHSCSSAEGRVLEARELTDAEILREVQARGL